MLMKPPARDNFQLVKKDKITLANGDTYTG